MRVSLGTVLAAPLDRVVIELERPRLLVHIAAPLIGFVAVDPPQFPERWIEGSYLVGLRLFGALPIGRQYVVIEFPPVVPGCVTLRDNGHGTVARRWDHVITLRARTDGGTDYRDVIDIEAGVLTPFVWAFAAIFYRHRQRRWRQLVAQGFVYD